MTCPFSKSNRYVLDIGRSVYHFCNIYTFQRDTQCSSTDCFLMHRCQLYMFRTVTVHPQELLFRRCMCRLWYVVRTALSDTSQQDVSDSAVLTCGLTTAHGISEVAPGCNCIFRLTSHSKVELLTAVLVRNKVFRSSSPQYYVPEDLNTKLHTVLTCAKS